MKKKIRKKEKEKKKGKKIWTTNTQDLWYISATCKA
jgi:hypothetical protein